MKTEARLVSPRVQFTLIIGAMMTLALSIIVTILLLFYPDAVRLVLYAVAGSIATVGIGGGGVWVVYKYYDLRYQIAIRQIEIHDRQFRTVARTDRIFDVRDGSVLLDAWHGGGATQQAALPAPEPTRSKRLPELVDDAKHFMLVGGTGSGKTTAACHLLEEFKRRYPGAAFMALDGHATKNEWPAFCEIVGAGRDWPAIGARLAGVHKLMNDRYQPGASDTPAIIVAIDEYPAAAAGMKAAGYEAKTYLSELAREARKVRIFLLLMAQGDSVVDLDIVGQGNIRDNFCKLRFHKRQTNSNIAALETDNGKEEVTLSGPYRPGEEQVQASGLTLDLEPEPTEQERRILDLNDAGESLSEICRQVYGSKGGKQAEAVKDVLERFG